MTHREDESFLLAWVIAIKKTNHLALFRDGGRSPLGTDFDGAGAAGDDMVAQFRTITGTCPWGVFHVCMGLGVVLVVVFHPLLTVAPGG
jgi:hypothetical protein